MEKPFSQEMLQRLLAGVAFVSRAVYLPSAASTNDALKRMAAEGAPEGTLIVADEQTAGRGRLDRRWIALPGSSLLLSILFRPTAGAKHLPDSLCRGEKSPQANASPLHLTMVCSLAARDAIREVLGLEIALKWPNDLVHEGRKLGGILTEIAGDSEPVQHAVVGIGINANWDPSAAEFDQPATSLSNLAGRSIPRGELLRGIVAAVAERYAALRAGASPAKEWEAALETVGQSVTVQSPTGILEGVATGVDADGALLVRSADGQVHRVVAGDVRVRSPRR